MNEKSRARLGKARLGIMAGLVALAGSGCIVEPPAPPHTNTDFEETVHLDADQPVAVRHLAFEVSPPSRGINVRLRINAHRFITETTGEFAEEVTLSVRSDDAATAALAGSPGDARPGAIIALTELCAKGCKSGVTVVVRGTSAARPIEDIAISAELSATGTTGDQSPLGTTLSLRDDGAITFDGNPAAVITHASPTIAVSPASPKARANLRLHVDPKLLTAPPAFPIVGSLSLRATGDPATHEQIWNHWGTPVGRLTVNGMETGMAPESGAYDIDWLRLCTAGEACEIEIGLEVDYNRLASLARVAAAVANKSAPPPPPEFRLTLDALARLEAFDGSELPSDGLTLANE